MKLSYRPHTLYFKRPFKIAHGTRTSTPVVIVELNHEGTVGYGEASMPPYLGESHESVSAFLRSAAGLLESNRVPIDIGAFMQELDQIAPGNTAAKAAIDIALHDLSGKLQNTPCWKLFGADKNATPFTTYTLGLDEPEVIRKKIEDSNEFKVLKVKLNGEDDRAVINTIRSITDKPMAIDVNQGWKNREQALDMLHWLADKNVLFVEQALPKNNWEDARWLFEKTPLPLYADESIQRYEDLRDVKDCFHGVNIKLMKCTGMNEAYKMIQQSRKLNLKVLIGCMSETSCAISAAAQLCPFADHADLDGSLLMSNDLFDGITFNKGKITLNDKPGIGVERR